MHPKDFREQALNFIAQLGLEEKTSLLSGSSFWDQRLDTIIALLNGHWITALRSLF
ncbi:MAG: hypothetical protein QF536_08285 [Arenicellales bacterium]|nr:hypothetical protein [Pseudomonadales bacterium]MDP6434333.1 hypothetical protein [Arenicellales bacterium]MDP6672515.1 hypothetical protein [Arenicellales bacterium]MDP6725175.1 hypothetical protein [Arenicellales bacterium]